MQLPDQKNTSPFGAIFSSLEQMLAPCCQSYPHLILLRMATRDIASMESFRADLLAARLQSYREDLAEWLSGSFLRQPM
jgi:hypothetical protein